MASTTGSYVCIVGRNKLFRAALKVLLGDLQFKVLCEFDDIEDVPSDDEAAFDASGVSLVLFDISSDADSVLADLKALRERFAGAPIVVLAEVIKSPTLEACLAGGAAGYLTKDISLEALKHSLHLVISGQKVYPSHLADMLINGMALPPNEELELNAAMKGKLSSREREILSCLVRGDSNKLIAIRLHITEATVKVHMKNLLRKIAASNRTQAAIWAVKHRFTMEPQAGIKG